MNVKVAILAALLSASPALAKAPLNTSFAEIPLLFEANQGQYGDQLKFLSRGAGYGVFLMEDEAVLRLSSGRNTTVRMKLLGAAPHPSVSGIDQAGLTNYFKGSDPQNWRTGIPTYSQVRYAGV